ncbi:MAG: OstA-like protein [Chlorobiota bacterium]
MRLRTGSIGLLLLLSPALYGQDRPIGPPLPVILHHADAFAVRPSDSGDVRELIGNVWLQQGNATLRCGTALQYIATGLVVLRHNVRLEQDGLRITAPLIIYDPAAATAVAEQGAEIRQDSRSVRARWGFYNIAQRELLLVTDVLYRDETVTLWTDTLRYHRATGVSHSWGGGYAESPSGHLSAEADTITYLPQSSQIRLAGSAILRQLDTAAHDTVWLTAATILLRRDSTGNHLRAEGSASIVRDTLWAARASRVLWEEDSGHVTLSGDPTVWYGAAELKADSIAVFLQGGQFSILHGYGNARLRIRIDTTLRMHQLKADSVSLRRLSDSLAELHAVGNTRTVYWHYDSDGVPAGLFRNSADRVELVLYDDSLQTARWLGKIYGEYVPEPLIGERPAEWSLPSLAWQEERPLVPSWRHRWRWQKASSVGESAPKSQRTLESPQVLTPRNFKRP